MADGISGAPRRSGSFFVLSTLLALCGLTISGMVQAAPVSRDAADQMASDWAYLSGWHLARAGWTPTPNAPEPATPFAGELASETGDVVAYKYRLPTGGDLVVVNEDGVVPVFFYSETNTFDPNANPTAKALYQELLSRIECARANDRNLANPLWTTVESRAEQFRDLSAQAGETTVINQVGPMVTTRWDQGDPYNRFCPMYGGTRCVVGCVATATAQIMNYWKYPFDGKGQGGVNYYTSSLDLHVEIDDLTDEPAINWQAITSQYVTPSSPTSEIDAVARLGYYVGATVGMDYGPAELGGSGAFSSRVPYALRNNWKYSSSVQYVPSYMLTTSDWESLMRLELDEGRPVFYGGQNGFGGHAFVLDGYQYIQDDDNEDERYYLYHFNLGWSGQCDGWYSIDLPGDGCTTPYSFSQAAVIGIGGGALVSTTTEPEGAGAVLRDRYEFSYQQLSYLSVTAVPYPGYRFSEWVGAERPLENPTRVEVVHPTSVIARFEPAYRIYASAVGGGTVTVNPDPEDTYYSPDQNVALTATPAKGWRFDHWEGDASGTTNPLTVVMGEDKAVQAVFIKQRILTPVVTGLGRIVRDPNGPIYDDDTFVDLVAQPEEGWEFRRWWGDLDTEFIYEPSIAVLMNRDRTVQAEFIRPDTINHPLSISIVGEGEVVPFGGLFAAGSIVELTATPSEGWSFVRWEGDQISTDNPLSFIMNGPKSVVAVFAESGQAASPVNDVQEPIAEPDETAAPAVPVEQPKETDAQVDDLDMPLPCSGLAAVLAVLLLTGFALIGVRWTKD